MSRIWNMRKIGGSRTQSGHNKKPILEAGFLKQMQKRPQILEQNREDGWEIEKQSQFAWNHQLFSAQMGKACYETS